MPEARPASPIRVFLCYEPSVRACAEKLDAWQRTNANLDEYDARQAISPQSIRAAVVGAHVREQIMAADVLVCLISEDARANAWVTWELQAVRAASRRIGLVAVMLQPWHTRPVELADCGAIFVPFKRDAVERGVSWAAKGTSASEDFELADE